MTDRLICVAAAAALLFALPAQGQNKCVDAQGKVFYQQGPCPGAVPKAPPPKVVEKKPESPEAKAARAKCERIENDIKEMRVVLPQLQPAQRDRIEKSIEKAEHEYAKNCKK